MRVRDLLKPKSAEEIRNLLKNVNRERFHTMLYHAINTSEVHEAEILLSTWESLKRNRPNALYKVIHDTRRMSILQLALVCEKIIEWWGESPQEKSVVRELGGPDRRERDRKTVTWFWDAVASRRIKLSRKELDRHVEEDWLLPELEPQLRSARILKIAEP